MNDLQLDTAHDEWGAQLCEPEPLHHDEQFGGGEAPLLEYCRGGRSGMRREV